MLSVEHFMLRVMLGVMLRVLCFSRVSLRVYVMSAPSDMLTDATMNATGPAFLHRVDWTRGSYATVDSLGMLGDVGGKPMIQFPNPDGPAGMIELPVLLFTTVKTPVKLDTTPELGEVVDAYNGKSSLGKRLVRQALLTGGPLMLHRILAYAEEMDQQVGQKRGRS